MTLRQALGGDVTRLHDLLDQLLDREDVAVLFIDAHRAVTYSSGFGASPCQHELLAIAIERMVRSARRRTAVMTAGGDDATTRPRGRATARSHIQ